MALLAFTFGDYVAAVVPIGEHGAAYFAAATIAALTLINLAGLKFGIGTQVWLMLVVIAGMTAVIGAGLSLELRGLPPLNSPVGDARAAAPVDLGAALVFVFLAYGGWSDTATLSAEVRDRRRGILRALIAGMTIVTLLYVLANWAYVRGLSISGLAASTAPAAELMRYAFGRPGEVLIVGIVALTSITSMNALLIAGSRTTYAAARDTTGLEGLGRWHVARGTPAQAIVAMAVVALALVGLGAYTRGGFTTMVDYLSPVYWLFLTLSGCALLVLRRRFPGVPRPFRVPGYPFVPLVFIASSGFLCYSSLAYVRVGALVGLGVLLAGVVLLVALRVTRARPTVGS
jgi:amino acid transporter